MSEDRGKGDGALAEMLEEAADAGAKAQPTTDWLVLARLAVRIEKAPTSADDLAALADDIDALIATDEQRAELRRRLVALGRLG